MMDESLSGVCIIAAMVCALGGFDGWWWFLVAAILFH